MTPLHARRTLELLRSGHTTAEICRRMPVTAASVKAVKAHLTRQQLAARIGASAAQLAAPGKAIRTAVWAHTMVKVLIRSVRSERRWEIVNFTGPAGRESAGIVDLMAIRKDHTADSEHGGDLFEIILIQVKGGGALRPDADDLERLRCVSGRYHAKKVVLAEWKLGSLPILFTLNRRGAASAKEAWQRVDDLRDLFE